MPRYFFDIDDGGQSVRDEIGLDLADRETARREAILSLLDLARDELPSDEHNRFVIHVREAAATGNDYLLIAALTVDAKWTDGSD